MRLFLIRHPRVSAPRGWCYGRSDLPLAADPAGSAAALRRLLPQDCATVSSPLQRCLRLAAALTPTPCIDADWQELDFGAWENRAFDSLPRADIDAWAASPWDFRMPQGESGADLAARVQRALARLHREATEDIAVVTHAGPIRAAVGILRGDPRSRWLDLPVPIGSLHCLTRTGDDRVTLAPPCIYAPEP